MVRVILLQIGHSRVTDYTRTYQEAVLARRRLYFSNNRVFLECERSVSHEDEYNSDTAFNELQTHKLMLPVEASKFDAYTRHVSNYASRQLSYRVDTYAAFAGIEESLFGPSATYYGLPLAHFDCALRWYAGNDDGDPGNRKHEGIYFPTWSWCSKMRPRVAIRYFQEYRQSFMGALAAWYRCDDDIADSIVAINAWTDTDLDMHWRTYMGIACSEGCVITNVDIVLNTQTWSQLHEMLEDGWPDYQSFYQLLAAFVPDRDAVRLMRDTPGAILAKTQTSYFNLRIGDEDTLDIVDLRGRVVGDLCGDALRVKAKVETGEALAHDHGGAFEFIALSVSAIFRPKISGHRQHYVDGDGEPFEYDPIVYVLLIGREGHIAHREALGWMYLMDWAASAREWKTILLQ